MLLTLGFFEKLTPPFRLILFYLYISIVSICKSIQSYFLISLVLLNILIALFNQTYFVITSLFLVQLYLIKITRSMSFLHCFSRKRMIAFDDARKMPSVRPSTLLKFVS